MANSDKDILITPATDTSDVPQISFVGDSNVPVNLQVLDSNDIQFSSTNGALLTVRNLNSGIIYQVNEGISGVPLFTVNTNGTVKLVPYGGRVTVGHKHSGDAYLSVLGHYQNNHDNPSIECGSIRFSGDQNGYVTDVKAEPHIYSGARFPSNGTGSYPFNNYGSLIFQASTRSGYNNDFVFATGSAAIGSTPSPSVVARISTSGQMRLNNAGAPSYTVHADGSIYASGEIVAFSDVRKKKNIETIKNALDTVVSLRGVSYEKIDSDEGDRKINSRYIGVIAQEIEKFVPEVITEDEDGMKAVAYGNIVGLLIESIKDLNNELIDLKKKLEDK